MTLLELLVQELPKRGGWPEERVGFSCVNFLYEKYEVSFHYSIIQGPYFKLGDDAVTRQQYESALAASQQPAWDGEGLPPVGCKFEYGSHRTAATCLGVGLDMVFAWKGNPLGEDYEEFMISIKDSSFHAARTEAERKREEAIESLMRIVCSPSQSSVIVNKIYDTIAAGKIPGLMTHHHEPNPTYEKTMVSIDEHIIHADNLTAESLYAIIESGKIAGVKLGR